jgi:hypothetical protein
LEGQEAYLQYQVHAFSFLVLDVEKLDSLHHPAPGSAVWEKLNGLCVWIAEHGVLFLCFLVDNSAWLINKQFCFPEFGG